MRLLLLVLGFAFLTMGCVARLPVDAAAPTPMAADPISGTVDRLRQDQPCFVRCGLDEEAVREAAEGGEEEEEFPLHEVAVFFGYTWERGKGGATLGVDYSYWFNERIGIGPFIDYVDGDVTALAAGAGVWFRPFPGFETLGFYVAPGFDYADEEEHEETIWEFRALLRLGMTAGFDIGSGLRIVPAFYWDIIFDGKQAYVLGLNIAKEF